MSLSLFKKLTFRHKNLLRYFLLLVAGLALATSGFWLWNSADASVADHSREELNRTTVLTATFIPASQNSLPRLFTGMIKSRQSSDLGFKRTGRVEKILVDQGDRVTAGQALAELDTAVLNASFREAKANLASAEALMAELNQGPRKEQIAAARARVAESEAQVRLMQSQYQRRKQLRQSGAISEQEFDDARFQMAAAEGRWEVAKQEFNELEAGTRQEKIDAQQAVVLQWQSTVQRLEVELNESILLAPFDGIVSRRFLDEGSVVAPGNNILSLVDQDSLEVWLGLPLEESASLQKDANFCFEIADRIYSGKFQTVLPELDARTRTTTVVFRLQFPENDSFRPPVGSLARLKLNRTVDKAGYWIDTTALVRGQRGLWSVYAVKPSETNSVNSLPVRDPVKIGGQDETAAVDSDNEWTTDTTYQQGTIQKLEVELLEVDTQQVLVRGPIVPGSRYVREGVHKLTTGQLVEFSEQH